MPAHHVHVVRERMVSLQVDVRPPANGERRPRHAGAARAVHPHPAVRPQRPDFPAAVGSTQHAAQGLCPLSRLLGNIPMLAPRLLEN